MIMKDALLSSSAVYLICGSGQIKQSIRGERNWSTKKWMSGKQRYTSLLIIACIVHKQTHFDDFIFRLHLSRQPHWQFPPLIHQGQSSIRKWTSSLAQHLVFSLLIFWRLTHHMRYLMSQISVQRQRQTRKTKARLVILFFSFFINKEVATVYY